MKSKRGAVGGALTYHQCGLASNLGGIICGFVVGSCPLKEVFLWVLQFSYLLKKKQPSVIPIRSQIAERELRVFYLLSAPKKWNHRTLKYTHKYIQCAGHGVVPLNKLTTQGV